MDVVVYVAPVAPEIFEEFLLHWYVGVPPFVGAAVNVTDVPAQIVVWLVLATTLGVTLVVTVTAVLLVVPLPHVFVGVTVTFPPTVPKVTVIEFVFEPDVIVAPVGIVHVYPVAPETVAIE